jgi:hypothetical protein
LSSSSQEACKNIWFSHTWSDSRPAARCYFPGLVRHRPRENTTTAAAADSQRRRQRAEVAARKAATAVPVRHPNQPTTSTPGPRILFFLPGPNHSRGGRCVDHGVGCANSTTPLYRPPALAAHPPQVLRCRVYYYCHHHHHPNALSTTYPRDANLSATRTTRARSPSCCASASAVDRWIRRRGRWSWWRRCCGG